MKVASVWGLATPPEQRPFEVELEKVQDRTITLGIIPSHVLILSFGLFSDTYPSHTLQRVFYTDILNVHWLQECQEPKTSNPFWIETGLLLGHQTNRPCASFIIYGETEGKHTDSLAPLLSRVCSQQSCKIATLCEMSLMQSRLQSKPVWLRDWYLCGLSDFNCTWEMASNCAILLLPSDCLSPYDITDIYAAMFAQTGFHPQNHKRCV